MGSTPRLSERLAGPGPRLSGATVGAQGYGLGNVPRPSKDRQHPTTLRGQLGHTVRGQLGNSSGPGPPGLHPPSGAPSSGNVPRPSEASGVAHVGNTPRPSETTEAVPVCSLGARYPQAVLKHTLFLFPLEKLFGACGTAHSAPLLLPVGFTPPHDPMVQTLVLRPQPSTQTVERRSDSGVPA